MNTTLFASLPRSVATVNAAAVMPSSAIAKLPSW